MSEQNSLEQLRNLITQKKSKAFYAEKLGISVEEVESLLQELKDTSKIENEVTPSLVRVNVNEGTLQSTVSSNFEAKSIEELANLHKINTELYSISRYESRQGANGNFTSTINATLVKKEENYNKETILEELRANPGYSNLKKISKEGKYAYEINISDMHFGKLAWSEESGEDFDLRIAEQRYETAISELLALVNTSQIERIIFPIGNDMINIDSRNNETFAGTRQDSDSRFFKIIRTVKQILIKNINSLSTIAPVDVIVVSGNHDPESMFMLGEILDAYYHNNPNVTIDNSPKQRKYYKYGKNGFQYTHGNEENHKDLGLIFATEQKELWANTDFRFAKLGHYHKNKKLNYVSVDEYQGFQVQIIPSLSGSDAWHNSKGYQSLKSCRGFLYHKEKGQIGEFSYNIPK